MATAAARKRGIAVDEQIAAEQVKAVFSTYAPLQEVMRSKPDKIPDPTVSASYALLGLAAERHAADALTAAMSDLISKHQAADGHFLTLPMRPPIESSEFTSTALSVRALQVYGKAPMRGSRPRADGFRTRSLKRMRMRPCTCSVWPGVARTRAIFKVRQLR